MSERATTYITTPIYYVNAQPHLGHAYSTVVADTYSRFCKLRGDDVRFQTGTDEHGDKIVEAAAKENIEPRQYVDRIANLFKDTWPLLDIDYDRFIRTTDDDHVAVVKHILQTVHNGGDIYFDEYSGLYCTGCERFLIERELVEGKCPDHLVEPKEITEQNYFFKMSRYQEQLIDHLKNNPEFVTPERYRNEVLSFLSDPLDDLCISRPASRLNWGIRLPFDENFVTYVWFDALINYLTGIGFPGGEMFERYWAGAEHLIAKDILKPHAIYWPTMLMAAGVPLYKKLHVHGYWNVDETKMSKSLGNVIQPAQLVQDYGVDTFRYFSLREMSFGLDASFSSSAIIARNNADLANDLGNLFSRSVSMIDKYCASILPGPDATDRDDQLQNNAAEMIGAYRTQMGDFKFHLGLQAVWEFVGAANRYIVQNEPWSLAKDDSTRPRLQTVLYNLGESLRLLALLLKPVMPRTAAKMMDGLGIDPASAMMQTLEQGGDWGLSIPGTKLRKVDNLFPRIDVKKQAADHKSQARKTKNGGTETKKKDSLIGFDKFKDIELRVAEIVAAEPVPKSTKLLKLKVVAPEERTIVSGIAGSYRPEELVGERVIIVANLKPAKLMGILSEGMLLTAEFKDGDGNDRLTLASVSTAVKPGTKLA
ncbi:MAG: methionine--tRNA ligase [Desulfofustis sp.]|nr:methionine--tRNA ligase [Desulfofustis sp.]